MNESSSTCLPSSGAASKLREVLSSADGGPAASSAGPAETTNVSLQSRASSEMVTLPVVIPSTGITASFSSCTYPSDNSLYHSWYGADSPADNESLLSSSVPSSLLNMVVEDASQDEGISSSSDFAGHSHAAFSHIPRQAPPSPVLSACSSPASFASPQMVGSSGQFSTSENNPHRACQQESSQALSDLIMPNVTVPVNKPFTDDGLRLGKLKILVAGRSSVGKTSLIDSLASTCDSIVHVDPEVSADFNDHDASLDPQVKSLVTEITASTKPLPSFRQAASTADVDTPRRQSLVDSEVSSKDNALDRNVCFVDSPGFDTSDSLSSCMETVINYLEEKFRRTADLVNISQQKQAVNLISSASSLSEFTHVDAILYLISDRFDKEDIDYIRALGEYGPVIPVLANGDLFRLQSELSARKLEILKEAQEKNLNLFLFDYSLNRAISVAEGLVERHIARESNDPSSSFMKSFDAQNSLDDSVEPLLFPCSVSSIRSDEKEMIASVLMASQYQAPLLPSEIKHLVKYILSQQGAAWLRYEAAMSFASWCVNFQISASLTGANASRFKSLVHVPQQVTPTSHFYSGVDGSTQFHHPFELFNDAQYTVPLDYTIPGHLLNARGRAQNQTARWVMQLEQASRTDNAISLRARTSMTARRRSERANMRRSPGSQTQTENTTGIHKALNNTSGKISDSISNMDPLGLRDLSGKIWNLFIKTASLVAGYKLLSYCLFSKPTATQIIVEEPGVSNVLGSVIDSLGQTSQGILVSALNSLGGGWSTITVGA